MLAKRSKQNKGGGTRKSTTDAAAVRRTERNRLKRLRRRQRRLGMVPGTVVHATPSVNARAVGSGIAFREFDNAVRSGIVPARYHLTRLGTTHAGSMAALQALHPAAENIGSWQWPDHNTSETVVLRNQDVVTVPKPTGDTAGSKVWNMNIYVFPTIDLTALVTRWFVTEADVNSPGTVKIIGSSSWVDTDHLMWYSTPWNAEGHYPGNEFQSLRLVARSLTAELVAAGLYDQGTIYAGQFNMDLQPLPVVTQAVTEAKVAQLVNEAMRDVLGEIRAVYNQHQHTVTAQQLGKASLEQTDIATSSPNDLMTGLLKRLSNFTIDVPADELDATTIGDPRPPVDETGFKLVYQPLPNNITDLVQNDKRYYQSDARHGVYMPLKHAGSMVPKLQMASSQYQLRVGNPEGGDWGHHAMFDNSFQVGVVMFRDLLLEASVNLKMISVIEGVPFGSSTLAKVAKPAPPLDQAAIDNVQEIMARTPNAYPASANSLGEILKTIANALAESGIPVVSDIAKVVRKL